MYTLSADGSLKLRTRGPLETPHVWSARAAGDRNRCGAHGAVYTRTSFEPLDGLAEELGAALLSLGDAVALLQQVVVDLVGDDAVLLVLRVLGHKLPHPLGHGHQLTC